MSDRIRELEEQIDDLSRDLSDEIEAHRVTRAKLATVREECAKVCDAYAEEMFEPSINEQDVAWGAKECAKRIRELGK